jgi:osmotically-inducible protein OsmY
MNDLALGSRVRADLAIAPATADLELEVNAHEGAVSIKGKVSTLSQIKEVKQVASVIAGVISLNLDELMPPVRV